jgi:hypothetical protein
MPRSSTTTSLWRPTAILLRQVCDHHGRTQPRQLDVLITEEALRLGLIVKAPGPDRCPKCGGVLFVATDTGATMCRYASCDYVSPSP